MTINDELCTLENVIENHHNILKEEQQYVISKYDWTVWGNMPLFSSKLKKVIGYNYDSAMELESIVENVLVIGHPVPEIMEYLHHYSQQLKKICLGKTLQQKFSKLILI